MIKEFIGDERAQGAIEYILLVGGIIVAAITIFSIYGQMTRETALKLNASVSNASDKMAERIESEIQTSIVEG